MDVRSDIFYKMANLYAEYFERASVVAGNIGRYLATMDAEMILSSPDRVFSKEEIDRVSNIMSKTQQRTKEEVNLMLDYGINVLKHFLLTGDVPNDKLRMISVNIVKGFVEERNQILRKLSNKSNVPEDIKEDIINKLVEIADDLPVINALIQGINVGIAKTKIVSEILREGVKGVKAYAEMGLENYNLLSEEGKYRTIIGALLTGKAIGLAELLAQVFERIAIQMAKGVDIEEEGLVNRFNTINNRLSPRPSPRL